MTIPDLQILEGRDLTKVYSGRHVVEGLNLVISKGEVVGLLGPNGAGKTTTFYMLVGMIRPDRGRVFLYGEDITELPMHMRARRQLIYLPQEPSIFRKLTVEENLLIVLERIGISKWEMENRLNGLLQELNMGHLRRHKGYTLSGGERRKLEILRSLILTPSFMLLDEPFAGIDPISVLELQRIILDLKTRGIGMLITDHNVMETLKVCDRAYIIDHGKVLVTGTPKEILESQAARESYLGPAEMADPINKRLQTPPDLS